MKNKIKVCIIQLTRFGDIIQTMQAISNFNIEREIEFSIVTRKSFSDPLRYQFKNKFKNIFDIDLKRYYSDNNFSKTKSVLNKEITVINENDYDLVINLTFSKTSAYLSTLINAKARTGLYFDNENQIKIDDKLSRYFYTNVNSSMSNSFHICDLFKQIIGLNSRPTQLIENHSTEITIHPFASKKKKMWSGKKWIEIIFKLLRDNDGIKINIIGSKAEIKNSKEITNSVILQKYKSRIFNFTGLTNIEETEKIIKKSRLLIAHDSLNIHIAAYNGIQSIMIALGSSRVLETSPYLESCYILSSNKDCFPCHVNTACDDFVCHNSISYQAVVELTNELIKKNEYNESNNINKISSFSRTGLILQKTIYKDELLQLQPIINLPNDYNIRNILNFSWNYYLNEDDLNIKTIDNNELIQFESHLNHLNNLFDLTQFGKKYSEYILREVSSKNPKLSLIKEYSNNIDEIEKLFLQLSPLNPIFDGILKFFKFERANLSGNNLVEITEFSYYSFQSMELFLKIVYELVNSKVKQPNKPVENSI